MSEQALTPERLAELFHDAYERLAPRFGYVTRRGSAVHWDQVPEPNKRLMIAVADEVLVALNAADHVGEMSASGEGQSRD